ncbi:hypothetical protein GC173_00010 [bacterium]|nr:hypothetical protein [bacterium]
MRTVAQILALSLPLIAAPALGVTVVTESDRLVVTAERYVVTLDRETGGLLSVTESGAHDWLARSFYARVPWTLRLGESEWIDPGVILSRGGTRAHIMDERNGVAAITWTANLTDESTAVAVRLAMEFGEQSFEGRVTADLTKGAPLTLLSYPAFLEIPGSATNQLVFPHRSGVVLNSAFFASDRTIGTRTPAGFAPFLWWSTATGSFSVSNPVDGTNRRAGARVLNLLRDARDGADYPVLHYDQLTNVRAGSGYDSGAVLFQVGATVADTARAYWNRGESSHYPTLEQKLGDRLFATLAAAPVLKYPEAVSAQVFTGTVPTLPSPAIIHVAGYMQGGHDERYPDYFPPRAGFGTTADWQAMTAAIRAAGSLMVPYTNPSWWDDESPTMTALGLDVVVRTADGTPLREAYGTKEGLVVTPWHPAVRERLAVGYQEFSDLGLADLLFEDQVGAREVAFDGNPASPTVWAYGQGALENTRMAAQRVPLMTELSWDQLAETESGFCGNMRLDWEQPALDREMYDPFPLAVLMANRNAAFYPHNLAGEVMVHDRRELLYNVALGYQLAFDLGRGASDWLTVAATVQRELLAGRVGETVVRFDDRRRSQGTTLLAYADGTSILANWSASAPAAAPGVTLPPQGFWITATAPRTEGGWIDSYRGAAIGGNDGALFILKEIEDGVRLTALVDEAFDLVIPLDWFPEGTASFDLRRVDSSGQATVSTISGTVAGVPLRYTPEDSRIELTGAPGNGPGWTLK